MVKVCFVCLGNICRSPTAEALMRQLVGAENLEGRVVIDSAGTSGIHSGEPPDSRARRTAQQRGLVMEGAARKFRREDFARFDYVLAMDADNYSNLQDLASSAEELDKLHLFRAFDPDSPAGAEVPDPYYGGPGGFDNVFDICEAACRGLLADIRKNFGL
jgi:protein-tyrosine phosphatase